MKHISLWLLFLILLFVGSYYREVLFRSVNALIAGENFFYAKTMALPQLQSWQVGELVKLKYGMTVGFSFFFMGLSILGLKLSFHEKWPYYLLSTIYLLLIVVAALVVIVGIVFLSFSEVYPILRMFIGWIHSVLPYLLLSAAYLGVGAYKKQTAE